jgi:hypothetical protein
MVQAKAGRTLGFEVWHQRRQPGWRFRIAGTPRAWATPATYQFEAQEGQADIIPETTAQIAPQSGMDKRKAQDQHGLGPGLGKSSASEPLMRPT